MNRILALETHPVLRLQKRTAPPARLAGKKAAPLFCSVAVLLAWAIAPQGTQGATASWSDGGGSVNWSEAANWTGSVLPNNGDNLLFATHPSFGLGNETTIHDLSTLTTVGNISFTNEAFTLNAAGSNALILTNGITNTSAVAQTINIPLTLGASQTWTVASALTVGGNVNLGANQLTIQGASDLVIDSTSTFSGTGAIMKSGTGQLTVNGSINSTGGLTISTGTLGGNAGGTIATSLAYDSTQNSTYLGAITGANTSVTVDMLTATQSNILTLKGNNTYGGQTHVISGFLGIDSANALSGSGAVVESGASIAIGGGVNVTKAVPITLSGDGVTDSTAVPLGALIGGAFRQADSSVAGQITLAGNARIGSFNLATFTLSGGIDTAGHTLILGSEAGAGSTLAITGAITGGGNVVVDTEQTHFGVANTYTGSTSIINGGTLFADVVGALPTTRTTLTLDQTGTGSSTLQLGADQAISSLSGTATSTVNLQGHTLTIGGTVPSTSTFSGAIIGAGGSLVKDGVTTLRLKGTNSYTGATTVQGGILSIDSASALSGSSITVASGGTLSINGGVNASTASPVTISGPGESPGGTPAGALAGSGFSAGASSFNAPITLGADATFAAYNGSVFTLSGTIATAGHTLTLGVAGASGTFAINSIISGAGGLIVASNTTLGGANTYTGSTAILNGANLIANVAGALPSTRSAVLIDQTGSGSSTLTLGANQAIASLTGAASSTVALGAHSLTIGDTNAATRTTFAGTITGAGGELIKDNASTLLLSGANHYSGGTIINAGRLITQNANALGTGTVFLNGGVLQAQGTLSIFANLNWNGGKISLAPASGDAINSTGILQNGGGGGAFEFDLMGTQKNTAYTLIDFLASNFNVSQFTASAENPNEVIHGVFTLSGTDVKFTITGVTDSGPIIQNAAPVGTPTFADFVVKGPVTTGGPTDNNTIQTLTFTPGGALLIHNTLFVTQGPVILVSGSTLTLDGSLSASQLQMRFGSLLNGNGSILGDLVNAGLVSPGHSPGRINVTGNYTQTPTGTLRIEIGGPDLSQHDLLSVGRAAHLGGTLQIVPLDGFKLKRDTSVTFLTAAGGVTGQFAQVESPLPSDTILQPTVIYSPNSVAVEAAQGSFETFAESRGLTANQKSVARALDSAAANPRTSRLLDYLDYRKLNQLPGDFDRIAPEELTSMFTIGVSLATVQSQNIQRRTDDIRSGTAGFSAAGLAVNGSTPSYSGSFGLAGPSGPMIPMTPILPIADDGKDVKNTKDPIPAEDNRWGAFLSGTGEWVSVGNTDNARGYDLTSGGFTLGLDYKVTPNLAIGLMAGYTGTSADLVDRGRVYVNGGKLGLYTTFFQNEQAAQAPMMSKDSSKDSSKEAPTPAPSIAKGFYADLAVNGGYNSYDTRRSALQGAARGDTDGGELNALAGIGYDFKTGGLTFGPTASFNYTYIGTNQFTEHGSLAPLNIHGGQGESLRTAFGLKASYDWKVGGILIKPEIRAAWQHEYGDAAYALDSSFANGAGHSFLVNGPQLGRDSVLLGAGFAIQFNERVSTYFYYDGELGRTNYESNSVTGGLRVAF